MSFRFGAEVVYSNAFYAAQGIKRSLSNHEIDVFCSFIRIAVDRGLKSYYPEPRCCRVTFDFDEQAFFERHPDYVRIQDRIVYAGPELIERQIDDFNLCLGFGLAFFAFGLARIWFSRWLESEMERVA